MLSTRFSLAGIEAEPRSGGSGGRGVGRPRKNFKVFIALQPRRGWLINRWIKHVRDCYFSLSRSRLLFYSFLKLEQGIIEWDPLLICQLYSAYFYRPLRSAVDGVWVNYYLPCRWVWRRPNYLTAAKLGLTILIGFALAIRVVFTGFLWRCLLHIDLGGAKSADRSKGNLSTFPNNDIWRNCRLFLLLLDS